MIKEFRILSPTAILGYGFPRESFINGIKKKPHLIAVDAGSTDPGPYYLGKGKPFTNRNFVKRDLKIMIHEGLLKKIPIIVGSCGGSGAKEHLEWCVDIVKEIISEENLRCKIGIIYADIAKETVIKSLKLKKIKPLPNVHKLTEKHIIESDNIVAQMGVEPIQKAIRKKCDIILCGRCYDPAVFAALPILEGFDIALALHMGKILECAAIAATPGLGSDSIMGILSQDSFILESLNKNRKFTQESTSAHTLYEKSDPYNLPGPGGALNLNSCIFNELAGGRVKVSGSKYIPSKPYYIKLEGARKIGYRSISIAGVRDPKMIKNIDIILSDMKKYVYTYLRKEKISGEIYFHIYGKNAVMGSIEPVKKINTHELGIVIEAFGKTEAESETICSITRSTLLHYGYEKRITTAGNLAFPFSPSDVKMGEVYEFSIYHLMEINNQDIFPIKIVDI